MTTAILIAQIIAVIIQACFLLVGIILIAGMIRQNEQRGSGELLDRLTREIDQELREAESSPRGARSDEWDGKWPPWDVPGAENTSN